MATLKAPVFSGQSIIWNIINHNNTIFGGTYPNGLLIEWNGVDAWTLAAPSYLGASDVERIEEYSEDGKLYAVTNYGSATYYVLRWDEVDNWESPVHTIAGYGSRSASLINHDGYLYFASWENGFLFRTDGVNLEGPLTTSIPPSIQDLHVFDNKIYGGGTDGKLYEWNDVDSWVSKANALTITNILRLETFQNELYAVGQPGALQKWNGVDAWQLVVPNYSGVTWCQGFIATPDTLYEGTNATADILRWQPGETVWTNFDTLDGINGWVTDLIRSDNKIYASVSGKLYEITSIQNIYGAVGLELSCDENSGVGGGTGFELACDGNVIAGGGVGIELAIDGI